MPCSQRQKQAAYDARCAGGDSFVTGFGIYYAGAPAGLDSKARAAVAFETYIRFFQDNGLTRRTILKPGDKIDLSTEIWASDLTEEGHKFFEAIELRWLRYLARKGTPSDASMLARALAEMRNPLRSAAAGQASEPTDTGRRNYGSGGKRKQKPAILAGVQTPPRLAKEPSEASPEEDPHVYDKAKWHYEGDFPRDLPKKQAFVHTGLFAAWLMEHDMVSEEFLPEAERFKRKEITGPQAYEIWDGVLASDMLTPEGNRFAKHYYTKQFINDYERLLAPGLPSSYHIEDSWANYDILKHQIDARYAAWKEKRQARKQHGKNPR